jgi:transglutaminase-like putative cysteine protease
MRLDIRYRTEFVYDELVRESQNELRTCPTSDDHQHLLSYRVTTVPSARVLSFTDYWGTRVDTFGVREPHVYLEVVAEAAVETRQQPLLATSPRIESLSDAVFRDEHVEHLGRSPHASWRDDLDEGVAHAAKRAVAVAGPDVVSWVLAIHRSAGAHMTYAPGSTFIGVDVEEVYARGRGVCQDIAHLTVAMCRSVGIPARYVSGYLFTADDSTGADSADDAVNVQTHAWIEAAIPGYGWLALDPTNQQQVGLRHVKIGHGRDYDDVLPLRGVYAGSSKPVVDVSVEIRRMAATPTPAGGAARGSGRRWPGSLADPAPVVDDLAQQQQQQ